MIEPPLPRAPSDRPTSAARATATIWPKIIGSVPQSSNITCTNRRALAVEVFEQRDSVLAGRTQQVPERCRRDLVLLQQMLAKTAPYFVDALGEEVHILGNSNNRFLPLHYAKDFTKFRAAHTGFGFNLLQIRRRHRSSAQRGFD